MKIIGIAASKNAGKTSSLNYIYGQVLTKNDVIDKFDITDEGKLMVPASFEDGVRMGEYDISRRDPAFVNYAQVGLWPFVKDYNFGTYIKETIVTLYNIEPRLLWGNQAERDLETQYTWEAFLSLLGKTKCPKGIKKTDKVTGRQFIQHFADILRSIDDDCFTRVILNQIEFEQVPVSIVGDVRRISELKAIQKAGGKVVYLTRRPHNDEHNIENEFKDYDLSNFDAVIDNQDMTIHEKNGHLHRICSEWEVF